MELYLSRGILFPTFCNFFASDNRWIIKSKNKESWEKHCLYELKSYCNCLLIYENCWPHLVGALILLSDRSSIFSSQLAIDGFITTFGLHTIYLIATIETTSLLESTQQNVKTKASKACKFRTISSKKFWEHSTIAKHVVSLVQRFSPTQSVTNSLESQFPTWMTFHDYDRSSLIQLRLLLAALCSAGNVCFIADALKLWNLNRRFKMTFWESPGGTSLRFEY